MTIFFDNKERLAAFVVDQLQYSKPGSPLTTIITPVKSVGYYVSIVTGESSEDTELQMAKFFSDTQVNI